MESEKLMDAGLGREDMNHKEIGKKIIVIGSPGSGKSYFSKCLAKTIGIPLIHLDKEYWNSGWVETSPAEWIAKHDTLLSGEKWIIDGNYGSTMDRRLEHADTVIYFDLNKYKCLMSCLKRIISNYGQVRSDMAEGCQEKFDFEFIKYIWDFSKTQGPRNKEKLARYPEKNSIVFKKRSEAERFLKELVKS